MTRRRKMRSGLVEVAGPARVQTQLDLRSANPWQAQIRTFADERQKVRNQSRQRPGFPKFWKVTSEQLVTIMVSAPFI